MDISYFVNWFIGQIAGLFAYIYSLLSRITFNGVSILGFLVYCLILGIVLDLFIISVRARAVRVLSHKEKSKSSNTKKGGSNEDK